VQSPSTSKGERNLKTVLGALAEAVESGISLRCLGIVFDANADAAVKLGSIAAALTNAGFDFNAAALDSHGIYGGGAMPIGVFISPGGGASGRIETMILREISDTPAQPCIETFAKCVDLAEARRLDEKGLVQVYLGSFSAAHGVAVAFEKALFDIRHTTYDAVREMVRQLTQ
jgi:hypothetical protein